MNSDGQCCQEIRADPAELYRPIVPAPRRPIELKASQCIAISKPAYAVLQAHAVEK